MEPLSGLWADLKKSGSLPTKGVLLTNCEAELTQLMKQIDVMVQAKRAEWVQEKQILQAKIDVREQEHTLTKSTLEQKHQEIGQLRCQMDGTEREKRDIVEQYERQLKALKDEVATMRKEYEKLKKQYRRYAHQEKNRVMTEVEESSGELRKLSKKLDDYRQKSKDWDQQKRNFQKQVETLESQRKMLADKCDLMQALRGSTEQQSSGYQSQLDKRRDMLDSAELTLRAQITQLEGQLSRARDTIGGQDSQLTHLKTTMEDAVTSQRRTLEEKEQMEETLQRTQNKVRQLETDLARCQSELEAENAHAHASDVTSEQLNRDKDRLEQALSDREAAIQRIKRNVMHEQKQIVAKLRHEIEVLLDENQKSRKAERFFRDEVSGLREKLDASRKDCEQLNEQMAAKIRELRLLDGQDYWGLRARRYQLEQKISYLTQTHRRELDQLQKEIADLSADLHKRNLALANLSEKSANMEQHIREQEEVLDRRSAEAQVANAQLEALRLESRHLRKMALRSTSGSTEEAEAQLKELQGAYSSSLKALEKQNESLQKEVTALRTQVHTLQDETGGRIESTLQETEKTLNKVKENERRRVDDSRRQAEQRAADLQSKLDGTVEMYEAQISALKAEVTNLRDDLSHRSQTLKRIGMENDAMTHFVGGVEGVVHSQPRRETSILLNTSQRSASPAGGMLPERDEENDIDDLMLDPVDVVTEQFLSQQEERTRELERKLDKHIEGLKVSMEMTNRKFLNER